MASVTVTTADGKQYHIAGIAKGAGMIAPNMATMLGFIVTDAALDPLQAGDMLFVAADQTFNRIVVDGDTSTNDYGVSAGERRERRRRLTTPNASSSRRR